MASGNTVMGISEFEALVVDRLLPEVVVNVSPPPLVSNQLDEIMAGTVTAARAVEPLAPTDRKEALRQSRDKHLTNAHRLLRIASQCNASDWRQRRLGSIAAVTEARHRVTAARTCDTILQSMCAHREYDDYRTTDVEGRDDSFDVARLILEAEIGALRRFLSVMEAKNIEPPPALAPIATIVPDDEIPF